MTPSTTYLRPIKGQKLINLYDNYKDYSHKLNIRQLTNHTVTPLGAVPGQSEHPQPDILCGDCDMCAKIEPTTTSGNQLQGVALFGGYISSQWGLFILNSTERLWPLFQANPIEVDHILFFAESYKAKKLHGNYKEFFDILGLTEKIIICDESISVENLIVPDVSFEHPVFYSDEFMYLFRRLRQNVLSSESKIENCEKLFFTRSQMPHAGSRSINIGELDRLLADNGYTIIAPERLSIRELVELTARAKSVASVSGTLAHNFLFCNPEAEFLIFERTAANNEYQVGVNMMMNITPAYIDAFQMPAPLASVDLLFLFAKTAQLKSFITDRKWIDNDTFPQNDRRIRNELSKFFKSKRKHFAQQNRFLTWELTQAAAIGEACAEAEAYYAPWLSGHKLINFRDIFSIHYLKAQAKRLLGRG